MKIETIVFSKLKKVIPNEAEKTAVFISVTDRSYEIFFYSWMPNIGPQQCYTLEEEGYLDGNELEQIFRSIARDVKADRHFQPEMINVLTVVIESSGVKMNVEYFRRGSSLYQIEKAWIEKYLGI